MGGEVVHPFTLADVPSPDHTIDINASTNHHQQQHSMQSIIKDSANTNQLANNKNQVQLKEDWLPITQSRTGNSTTILFHLLSSGIGHQALLLPLAFATLGCINHTDHHHHYLQTIKDTAKNTEGNIIYDDNLPLKEDWLPITESRNGNSATALFHLISSGLGNQALLLPLDFATHGWAWGIICLSLALLWQLYTIWLLVDLHESIYGTRYSRYLHLAVTAFGLRIGKLLVIFPVMYLSGGTCTMLIIKGGGTMQILHKIVSGDSAKSLSGPVWFLAFTCIAIALAYRPNLNSISGMSFIASITAVTYCTMIWVLPVSEGRPSTGVSYDTIKGASKFDGTCDVFNAIGVILLAFRGHNLVLEIQGTLPSSSTHPCRKRMWRGVVISYAIIAACLYPLAIAGFWAYGNKVPSITSGGLLNAFPQFYGPNSSRLANGLIYLLVIINCLTSFQIYAMPVFDNLEIRYTTMKNKPCPGPVRTGIRLFFGGLVYLVSVSFPFLTSLMALIGGITLSITFAYPCFMWILMNKSHHNHPRLLLSCLNHVLGCLGVALGCIMVIGASWTLATKGLHANFLKP